MIAVRQATVGDIPRIAELIAQLALHEGEEPPDPARLALILEAIMGSGTSTYLLAELDGRAVGILQLRWGLSTWKAAPYGYLEDFFVVEDMRRKGIGTALLEMARHLARERGCVELGLDVRQANEEARRFYAKNGFCDTGSILLRLEL